MAPSASKRGFCGGAPTEKALSLDATNLANANVACVVRPPLQRTSGLGLDSGWTYGQWWFQRYPVPKLEKASHWHLELCLVLILPSAELQERCPDSAKQLRPHRLPHLALTARTAPPRVCYGRQVLMLARCEPLWLGCNRLLSSLSWLERSPPATCRSSWRNPLAASMCLQRECDLIHKRLMMQYLLCINRPQLGRRLFEVIQNYD